MIIDSEGMEIKLQHLMRDQACNGGLDTLSVVSLFLI